MQRHLKPQPAQPAPIPTLSVEEEAILADEHSEAGIIADNAAEDVDRLQDVADVAQDAIQVVDITPECGTVEQGLVEAVGEMAVAGTDADPSEVISMPVADGEILSVEGIASALKSIWDAIVTAIKNMWVGLKHWLTTYFSTLEQNKKHAESLIERLNGMKGQVPNSKNENITITDIFNYDKSGPFSLYSKTVGDEMRAYNKLLGTAIGAQKEFMSQIGTSLEESFKKFDGHDTAEISSTVDNVTTAVERYIEVLHLRKKGNEFSSDKVTNVTIVASNYDGNMKTASNSFETKVALLSKVRFNVKASTDFASENKLTVTNDVTPDILHEMASERLDDINYLLKYKNETFTDLEKRVEAVEKACGDMLGRVKEDDKEGTVTAKRLMPLVTAFANWGTQPAQKILEQAARHNKFWLSLYEKVANNFHQEATA